MYKTMLSYCLKCRGKQIEKNLRVIKTKNGRIMILSNCAVCGSKRSNFIKEQEGNVLLGRTLGKISILDP